MIKTVNTRAPAVVGSIRSTDGLLTLIAQGVKSAIYRKEIIGMENTSSFDGYEVVVYRYSKFNVFSLGGRVRIVSAGFKYPSSEEFGRYGFAYRTLKQAKRKFNSLESNGIESARAQ